MIDDEKHFFNVKPNKGEFGKEEEIKFNISFTGNEPIPYFEYACLIADDLPIAAIQTPPALLVKNIEDNRTSKNEETFEGPGYFAANSIK